LIEEGVDCQGSGEGGLEKIEEGKREREKCVADKRQGGMLQKECKKTAPPARRKGEKEKKDGGKCQPFSSGVT